MGWRKSITRNKALLSVAVTEASQETPRSAESNPNKVYFTKEKMLWFKPVHTQQTATISTLNPHQREPA